MPLPRSRTSANEALVGIWNILLASTVVLALYFARDILIPLALASFLTFILAPLVARLQRWLGRIGAVVAVVTLIVALATGAGWVLTRQIVDLAGELPNYKENIRTKLRAFQNPEETTFERLSETIDDLKQELPGVDDEENQDEEGDSSSAEDFFGDGAGDSDDPVRVRVVGRPDATPVEQLKTYLAPLVGPLGTAALVLLLLVFMLLKREDLRARVIRLIGQGRIGATARAMDDAGARVSRYLLMLLVVNVTYGIPVAIGLYFIGVPNAVLWGAFAIILRFIPYLGPWIAAAFPVLLSLAVSPDWKIPMMTISLFIVLEILSNNVMEPWLYGSSTGVTPVALIVAAVFWTWLWGPVGLVLATPFTVCLVVMGRHVPRLEFLAVMLSDEDALTPAEDCYHRLLRVGEHDDIEVVDQYRRNHSLPELYDSVLLPVLVSAEADHRHGLLDVEQRNFVAQGLREIVEELGTRPRSEEDEETSEGGPRPPCSVHLVPARGDRDEVASMMLSQMLGSDDYVTEVSSAKFTLGEKIAAAEVASPDVVCISVIAPARMTQARVLCQRLRDRLPGIKIVVGLWALPEKARATAEQLREAGADEVIYSFAEAVETFHKLAAPMVMKMTPAPIPQDDEERLEQMEVLSVETQRSTAALDAQLARIARIFEVDWVLVTAVGRDRQWILAHHGVPEPLQGETPRQDSICGHVVALNEILVVEDLARDRRFANNPAVKETGMRFYAGAPLRMPDGKPLGSLCLMHSSPRRFNARELRLLDTYAEEISQELARAGTDTAASTVHADIEISVKEERVTEVKLEQRPREEGPD